MTSDNKFAVGICVDNIDHPPDERIAPLDKKTETTTAEMSDIINDYTLTDLCKAISKFYNKPFKNLNFNCPMQLTDGSVATFVDKETNQLVASAKLRFRNHMTIDKQTGTMLIQAYFTDLSFIHDSVNISVNL